MSEPHLIKDEALAQVFSCEFCKISKNNFSYRTPPVAAPENTLLIYQFFWVILLAIFAGSNFATRKIYLNKISKCVSFSVIWIGSYVIVNQTN